MILREEIVILNEKIVKLDEKINSQEGDLIIRSTDHADKILNGEAENKKLRKENRMLKNKVSDLYIVALRKLKDFMEIDIRKANQLILQNTQQKLTKAQYLFANSNLDRDVYATAGKIAHAGTTFLHEKHAGDMNLFVEAILSIKDQKMKVECIKMFDFHSSYNKYPTFIQCYSVLYGDTKK